MATVTIDGKTCEFEKGETVLQVAERNGIEIPHYCYHPGLSIAANCRVCLVEIEKQPKPQPACQWQCTDGMVVHTASEKVLQGRRTVVEFLLLNHPVDCPICDQAGECKLQDYWMAHDREPSRLWDEREKLHKPKAVDFGPRILYDAERCILCTRCIRFCREIANDPVLNKRHRGNHTEILLEQDRKLDHRYTHMTAQICPVGALTTKDFRFRTRVWFLQQTETVCPGCATGCNAYLDVGKGTAYRMRARENQAVNRWWMCDDGCLTYKRIHEERVLEAVTGRGSARKKVALSAGMTAAAESIRRVPGASFGVVLSAQHTVEENEALVGLARDLGAGRLYLSGRPDWGGDAVLRNTDQNPNRAGAIRAAGDPPPASFDELLADVKSGRMRGLLVLGQDAPAAEDLLAEVDGLEALVVLASNEGALVPHAKVVLPVATFGEVSGTWVNAKGLEQKVAAALKPRGDSLPATETIARLGRALRASAERPAQVEATAP